MLSWLALMLAKGPVIILEVECKILPLETTQNEWMLGLEYHNKAGKTIPFFSLAFMIQTVKLLTAFDPQMNMLS